MTDVPGDRQYSKDHEWAQERDGRIVVGITHFAQDQLGDVVFVGLPEPGTEVTAGEPLGEVESTKSVSDVYSPVTGKVLEKNADVEQTPELVNTDPYGAGWLVSIEASGEVSGLMSAEEYEAHIGEQG
ncbi:MAG: glycine cleavage system protein GcvH [Actinomycetota bacterium]|nr:glycine cleavage system protein GcvH [Actinomycetota bacterium]